MPFQDGLRQSSVNLDPLAALRAPISVLLGVTPAVADLLRPLGASTVLDLATLPLFTAAHEIVEAANRRGSGAVARLDSVPLGYVTENAPRDPDALAGAELTALRGVSDALAQQLHTVLQIETVGDLGRWLPFNFARQILQAATRTSDAEADPAAELVPRMGEYPTERCFYTTMLIDQVTTTASQDLTTAGAIDVAPAASADFGFNAPAVGARLTFSQSWFAHGVTLGNLLHSVALAPGESTRIAVVDWTRQTRTSGTESITESERLTASTSHNRAVSEVQEAVATEAQRGFSHTESTATTKQGGLAIGGVIGPVLFGGSASAGKTSTTADSFSSSFGSRELAASMSQKVMDATQQAASSVRDRRASLVTEVSESEHESVSTRILANYNHMHALTVQYYEVIEIYRVVVDLMQVERCLFVPMKLVQFDEASIRRFQGALADAALTRRARELLTGEFGTVRLTAVAPSRPFRGVVDARGDIGPVRSLARLAARRPPGDDPGEPTPEPEEPPEPPPPTPPRPPRPPAPGLGEYDFSELARAARIAGVDVVRPGSTDVFLPRDAALLGVLILFNDALVPATGVMVRLSDAAQPVAFVHNGIDWLSPRAIALESASEIVLTTNASTPTGAGRMTLQLAYHGALFPVTIPIQLAPNATATVCRLSDLAVGSELLDHLRANRLHYSQAVWRSLDASTIALLLSRFVFEGRPVADLVDPQPLMMAGNYVVLRMPAFTTRRDAAPEPRPATGAMAAAREAWSRSLDERGLIFGPRSTSEQLVPIPTGGVFAEAVLGRSNSAERLDATRFWNWQDSPIPLAPPEIAAINLQSRAQPVDARPGQLGQPVLNIVNPTPLPDPTGVGASLAAIQNGNMFRDMSGLAATVGLAQAVAGNSASAAASAGQLANANLAVAAQHDIEKRKIDAQMATSAMAAGSGGGPGNISEKGAMVNLGRDMDKHGVGGGRASGNSSPSSAGGSGSGGSVESGDFMPGVDRRLFDGGGGGSGGNSGFGAEAFRHALHGTLGLSAADIILARGGFVPTPPAKDHLHVYGKWVPPPEWAAADKEVEALENGTWKPGTPDFDALVTAIPAKEGTRMMHDMGDFLDLLSSSKVRRINMYIHVVPASSGGGFGLGIAGELENDGGMRIKKENIFDFPLLFQLKGTTLRNEGRMLSKDDPYRRELWLYHVGGVLEDDFLFSLASYIGRQVFAFPVPVWFLPEFSTSPAKIVKRGRLDINPNLTFTLAKPNLLPTRDPLSLDKYTRRFDPYT
jgi:hypothetical protein